MFDSKISISRRVRVAISSIVGIRILALFVASFLPLSLPGIWRQTDTMGVALRYWLRWTVETNSSHVLLPAVLNSGDTPGIMPMEFPLLNIFFAPTFMFGPHWGKIICMLGVFLLVHGLIFANYFAWRKNNENIGVDAFALFLIAVASFSSGWTGKFVPDLLSVLLVLYSVGQSWNRPRPAISGILATLGLLMKPTSVVVLVLFGAHPKFFRCLRQNLSWCLCAILIAILYYTIGTHYIARFQQGPGMFALGFRPPILSLIQFFSDVKNWTNMWMYRVFFSLGLPPVFFLSAYAVAKKKPGYGRLVLLWAVLLTQYILIAALDGPHAFTQDYYFLGLAPTSALILGWLFAQTWPKWVPVLLLMGIAIPTLELSTMDLKTIYKSEYRDQFQLSEMCEQIRLHHPEAQWNTGKVYRSSEEEYPALGLCFGEREKGSISPYGFFWNGSLPASCVPLETTPLITFARC